LKLKNEFPNPMLNVAGAAAVTSPQPLLEVAGPPEDVARISLLDVVEKLLLEEAVSTPKYDGALGRAAPLHEDDE
jgi:hypothetical protein